MKSCLPSLATDRQGTSAIEFALVAPVLALFTIGIADLSMGLARKFQLEQASYRVLEMVTVGTLQGDYEYLKGEAAAAAEIDEDNVDVDAWLECDGINPDDFDTKCEDGEQTARFVNIELTDDYEPIFDYGPLGDVFTHNVDGKVRLTARSTVRIQ